MRRGGGAAAILFACLLASPAAAQGLFDLFGPDDAPAARRAPRPDRAAPQAEKKKAEAAKKKRDAKKSQPDGAKSETKTGSPSAEAPPPPYEGQLLRLSEVMGALVFLRDLCGDKDSEDWRDKMSALLDAEAPNGPRREKYVAAFNRGFRGYELTYRVCTANAKVATARYLDEAGKISRDITYRFGSP